MSTAPPLVTALARALVRHPWKVVLLAALCAAAGGGFAWARLGFVTNRMALIGEQHLYNQNFLHLQEEFGDVDAMVVVLGGELPRETLCAAAETLAKRILARPDAFPDVFHRFPTEAPRGKALLFIDPQALRAIEARLGAGGPAAAALFSDGLGGFLEQAAHQAEGLAAAAAEQRNTDSGRHTLAMLDPFVRGLQQALQGEDAGPKPWQGFVPSEDLGGGRDGYIWTQDGRLVLLVQPTRSKDLEAQQASVSALRALLDQLSEETPGLSAGLTGEPVLEVDELATFRRDALLASLASLLGVTLLFTFAFWRLLGPILALGALLSAVLCTLGVAAVWPGHLNLISMAFCALMAGLGVDYAIHLISRYDEERARGLDPQTSLHGALGRTGQAIAGGAVTTALAFLATLFTDVEGIREFAFVAGVGIMLCMVANLTVLPALVVLADRGFGGRSRRPRPTWPRTRLAAGLDRLVDRRPLAIVAGCLALAALALGYALIPVARDDGPPRARLRYDANLLRLQAQSLPSVRLADEVLSDPGVGGMFAAVIVRDRSHLARVEEALRTKPTVASTVSLREVVGNQELKLTLVAAISERLAGIELGERGDTSAQHQLERLRVGLEAILGALESIARGALAEGHREATDLILSLQEHLEAVADAAAGPEAGERLVRYEERLRADLGSQLERLREECATEAVTDAELPAAIRNRFVGKHGSYLIRVYPREDIWEEEHLVQFVEEIKTVVPDVGGVPIQFHESEKLLRRGYARAGQIALAFVVMYLLVHFRGMARPLIATLTLLVGFCWGAGLLALMGLGLNPANLLALPLTLGIGIDYAIHLVHRDREARRFRSLAGAPAIIATSTGRAVLLSALTTVVGFGALGLSAHRGVASIGWTLCIAVLASLAAAILFCPALLRLYAGPSRPLSLEGRPGPKTGPGGRSLRPGEDPEPTDR